MEDYDQKIQRAKSAVANAEYILIGGGAGLSDAAGLTYTGKRFTDHFADFMEKYGFADLYTSSFYPFETEEERWAYWARHIAINRYDPPATDLYKNLYALVQNKKYFALTTNVEYQFHKAGFPGDKVFMVQGDYGFFQCARACHERLYDNEKEVRAMIAHTQYCRIPTFLVPKCPMCGGKMEVYVHKNQFFIQEKNWHSANQRYMDFVECAKGKNVVFLELGVGYNTPGIIRYPFEQMTHENSHATLIRINTEHPGGIKENTNKTIAFTEDMYEIIKAIH